MQCHGSAMNRTFLNMLGENPATSRRSVRHPGGTRK
jgi:hypothetical protein